MRIEPVDLNRVAEKAVEMAGPLIDDRRHELIVSLSRRPLLVEGDSTRLTQVLCNLLNNAAKFTDPGGRIWLSVERAGSEAVIEVRDNGLGMNPESIPEMFELFTQANRSFERRQQCGLGLGLPIVRRIVQMHGGRVDATSPGPGRGSDFVIHLPVRDLENSIRKAPAVRRFDAHIDRVLVVDDNADVAEALEILLSGLAHEIRTAHNGQEALDHVREFRPEIIFLDLGLPGMDGYEVVRRIREEPGMEKITIVAVTGYGQEEDRRRSREAGFDQHWV